MTSPEHRDGSLTILRRPLTIAVQTTLALCLLAAAAAPLAAPAAPFPTTTAAAEDAEVEVETGTAEEAKGGVNQECLEEAESLEMDAAEFCDGPDAATVGTEEAEAAEECPLRSARVHAAARRSKLKLTVGYTSYQPAKATVKIRRGAVRVGSFQRRLGRSGVLRFTEPLGEKPKSRRIVVRIEILSLGRHCAVDDAVLFR